MIGVWGVLDEKTLQDSLFFMKMRFSEPFTQNSAKFDSPKAL
jgi:hypothetical protein